MFYLKTMFALMVCLAFMAGCGGPADQQANAQPQEDAERPEPPPEEENYLTLEEFGGEAYYKRFDGDLTYTPFSADPTILEGPGMPVGEDYTRITYTGDEDVFDDDDLGMSFCGLFVHQNPGDPDETHPDLYYPNINGSRYAEVVRVIDGKNILVDFEFNGRNIDEPQVVEDEKGYIFFDNSDAWRDMFAEYTSENNDDTEIRLREHSRNGALQTAYIIPQFDSVALPDKPFKIWTGTENKARVKLGVEDYFQWDQILGEPKYRQGSHIFGLSPYDHDIILHNIVWLPPHRRVPEVSPFTPNILGRTSVGPCERIVAIIGNTALDEKREIEANGGLTDEVINCKGIGFVHAGGKYEGEGVAEEIVDFQYFLIKDFEHAGPGFIDMKANSGAGNYLVMKNVTTDASAPNPNAIKIEGRFTADKSGMHPGIVERDYYPDWVFEITSGHSFYQVDNSPHIQGWMNRTNIIHVDRFVFLPGNTGTWENIYENVYSEGEEKFNWRAHRDRTSSPMRTGRKHMIIQQIPREGERYVISRDYTVQSTLPVRTVDQISPDHVRGFPNWSVILQKALPTAAQRGDAEVIDPAEDIPENSRPIQLQAGDQFRIVGRGDEIYTVQNNQRGPWSQFNTEYDGREVYHYTRHQLDKNLPEDLPLAFEIEMVKSTGEILLDGEPRPAYLVYKSNHRWNIGEDVAFGDSHILSSRGYGHISYNHREIAMWAKNVVHDGFYRQSQQARVSTYRITDPDTGEERTVHRLGRYSPGYTLINSRGFRGEFSRGMNDFAMRDKIQRYLGNEIPEDEKPKMRLYNCEDVNTGGVADADNFLEVHETTEGAPDMPAPCRELLNRLPG